MASHWHMLGTGLLVVSSLANAVTALPSAKRNFGTYELVDSWQGEPFFNGFDFFTGTDPTKGFVTYVDQDTAQNDDLVGITPGGSVYIGVDHTSVLDPNGAGRKSVRIESKKSYDYGLFIVDLKHMPGSACGSWPAFWTVGPNWPEDGEIDIIESVNLITNSQIVLHTEGSCSVSAKPMSGSLIRTECGSVAGTEGCLVNAGSGTCGTPFNAAGGGMYAMEWTKSYIAIWHFPRGAIPDSITSDKPDVSTFGTPKALFQGSCIFDDHFRSQRVVFDTTFCGDWAGNVFAESGCPLDGSGDHKQSCHNYVASHPSDYKESYWEVNSVKIYQGGANATLEFSSAAVSSTVAPRGSSIPLAASATGFSVGVAKQTVEVTQTNVQGAQATVAAASRHLASEESSIDIVPVAENPGTVAAAGAAAHSQATEMPSDSNTIVSHSTTVKRAPIATQKCEIDINDDDETLASVAVPEESNPGATSLKHGIVPSGDSDDDEPVVTGSQALHLTDDESEFESESESEPTSGVAAAHSSAVAETNDEDDNEFDTNATPSSDFVSSDDPDDDQEDSTEIHIVPAASPSNIARDNESASSPNAAGVPAATIAAPSSGVSGSAATVATRSSTAFGLTATYSSGVAGSYATASVANAAAAPNPNGVAGSAVGAIKAAGVAGTDIANPSGAPALAAVAATSVPFGVAAAPDAITLTVTGIGSAQMESAVAAAATVEGSSSDSGNAGNNGNTGNTDNTGQSEQSGSVLPASATDPNAANPPPPAGTAHPANGSGNLPPPADSAHPPTDGSGGPPAGGTGNPPRSDDPAAGGAANPHPGAPPTNSTADAPQTTLAGGSRNPPAGDTGNPAPGGHPSGAPVGSPIHTGPSNASSASMTTHPTPSSSLPVVAPPPALASSTVTPIPSFGPVPSFPANTSSVSPEPTTPVITGGHTSSVAVVPPGPGPNTATMATEPSPTHPGPTPPLFIGAGNKISFHARSIIGTAVVALLNSHVLLNIFH